MSTFNMGEFMKFNKPHQQQIQQQTMMNHQLINQGMPSVASIWEATRAMISTQEVAQDYGKQSQREANTQPPPPAQHTQHIASIWEATRAMISTQEVAQDWGKQSLREANTQPPPPAQHTQHSLSWSAQVAQQSIPGTSSGLFNTNPAHQQPQVQSVQIQQQQQQQQQHHQQQQQQQTHHQQQPRQQEYVLLSNEFNYDCEHCSFSGTSKENLQDHMRLHAAERPHICGICGLSFTYKDSLEKHMANHKVKSTTKTYPCNNCSMIFASRADLQAHALTHAVNCGECNEQFMDQASLDNHKKVHNVKKGPMLPFMCALCKIGCATSKELSGHMKEYHTGGGSGGGSSKPTPPKPREGKRNAPRQLPQQEPEPEPVKKKNPPRVIKKATVPIYSEDVTVLQPDGKLVQYKERPWKCAKCRKGFQLPGHLKVHVRKCVPSSI